MSKLQEGLKLFLLNHHLQLVKIDKKISLFVSAEMLIILLFFSRCLFKIILDHFTARLIIIERKFCCLMPTAYKKNSLGHYFPTLLSHSLFIMVYFRFAPCEELVNTFLRFYMWSSKNDIKKKKLFCNFFLFRFMINLFNVSFPLFPFLFGIMHVM